MSTPILTTKADIARELEIDPRRKVMAQLEPVGHVRLNGQKLVPVYDRAKAVDQLAALLKEAQEKFGKQP